MSSTFVILSIIMIDFKIAFTHIFYVLWLIYGIKSSFFILNFIEFTFQSPSNIFSKLKQQFQALMGVISSICCQNQPQKKRFEPTVTSKQSFAKQASNLRQESENNKVIQKIEQNFPAPKNKKVVNWQDFDITHIIGKGGFGEVFLGDIKDPSLKKGTQKYAIKRISKLEVEKKKISTSIRLQKKILNESVCNFITSLHYAFADQHFLYLVMEWAEGGDTYTLINKESSCFPLFKKAGDEACRFILASIILGMEYLHSKNILYRDLKPENVLIFANGYVKLTDFGLSKQISTDQLSKTEVGTTFYYAPEMVLLKGYSKEVDLWMLGIFAYELSNYTPPFRSFDIKNRGRVKKVVQAAQQKRNWSNPETSNQMRSFINALLKFQPSQRLGYNSWDEVKNHQFFKSVNFDWEALKTLKMKSPLSLIVQSQKARYRPYVPQDDKKMQEQLLKSMEEDFQSWTKNSLYY